MRLPEWDNLPKNEHMILLNRSGDDSLQHDVWKNDGDTRYIGAAKNLTFTRVTVYNELTDRVSDKTAYKAKDGRLYINCGIGRYGQSKRLFLDEFRVGSAAKGGL